MYRCSKQIDTARFTVLSNLVNYDGWYTKVVTRTLNWLRGGSVLVFFCEETVHVTIMGSGWWKYILYG